MTHCYFLGLHILARVFVGGLSFFCLSVQLPHSWASCEGRWWCDLFLWKCCLAAKSYRVYIYTYICSTCCTHSLAASYTFTFLPSFLPHSLYGWCIRYSCHTLLYAGQRCHFWQEFVLGRQYTSTFLLSSMRYKRFVEICTVQCCLAPWHSTVLVSALWERQFNTCTCI